MFETVVKTAYYNSRRPFWKINVFILEKKYNLQIPNLNFERFFFGTWSKNFRRGWKKCILRVRRNISGNRCFFEKSLRICNFFSDMEWTIFGLWWKIFRRGCQKCILSGQGKFLGEKYTFWQKKYQFVVFSDFERRFFGLWVKTFRKDCQKCIPRAQRNILGFENVFV